MFSFGATLTILCSIGWASADVLRKKLATDRAPLDLSIRLAGTQLLLVLLISPFLHMAELEGWSSWQLHPEYWLYALPTFVCSSIGHLLFIKALRTSDLSLTIPFLSFSPIFVMLTGVLLLGERPSLLAGFGICVVVLGAVKLDNRGSKAASHQHGVVRDDACRRGRLLILGTALSWSIAAAFDKGAVAQSTPLTHLILLLTATCSLLALFKKCLKSEVDSDEGTEKNRLRGQLLRDHQLWLTSAVMLFSFALQLAAYTHWEVAYVESVKRAIGLICSVAFGAFIFHEEDPARRLPAVVTMGIGSTCVILG